MGRTKKEIYQEEEIERNKEEVKNIIKGIIDKGSKYIIKSMPVNGYIKDILLDVKEALDEEDFANMIKVAISSSINEGLMKLGLGKNELSKMEKMVDIAFDGGLAKTVNMGIDVVGSMKRSGNVFYNYIDDFIENLKSYVQGTDFKKKVYSGLKKSLDKVEDFKDMCNDWYDAYDDFNVGNIKNLAGKLNRLRKRVAFDNDCLSENNIIQNVTRLVSRDNKKLTTTQFDICSNIDKI